MYKLSESLIHITPEADNIFSFSKKLLKPIGVMKPMYNPQRTVFFALLILFLSSAMLVYADNDTVWGLSPKNLQGPVSVYRFFHTVQGGHLYTISTIERDYIINNLPEWNYEGTKFRVYEALTAGTAATYRFFNTITGIQRYTISEIERDMVMHLPDWTYEGVPFYVDPPVPAPVPRTGKTLSYRTDDDGYYQMGADKFTTNI